MNITKYDLTESLSGAFNEHKVIDVIIALSNTINELENKVEKLEKKLNEHEKDILVHTGISLFK